MGDRVSGSGQIAGTRWRAEDARWLARALALTARVGEHARPNPGVGCVLVRDGEVLAEGWTQRPDAAPTGPWAVGAHAEAHALARAGVADDPDVARGATAYVTLEPCNHTGRTGPCSVALVRAGVARVVHGLADDNPVAAGGAQHLRGAGVDVVAAPAEIAAWIGEAHHRFRVLARRDQPWLTLKLAQTPAGAVVADDGRWITAARTRAEVHHGRAAHDGVLVGAGTVLADDPRLDVRTAPAPAGQPVPVVLDRRGRTPPDAVVVHRGAVVVTAPGGPDGPSHEALDALRRHGARILEVADRAAPDWLVRALTALRREEGLGRLYAEPGPTLARALLEAGLVDDLEVHVGGIADGGPGGGVDLSGVTWVLDVPTRPPDDAVVLGRDVRCRWSLT